MQNKKTKTAPRISLRDSNNNALEKIRFSADRFGHRADDWLALGDWLAAGEKFKSRSASQKRL